MVLAGTRSDHHCAASRPRWQCYSDKQPEWVPQYLNPMLMASAVRLLLTPTNELANFPLVKFRVLHLTMCAPFAVQN